MKVSIAVNGHFHAMQLASQLEKRQMLQQLITTYPKRFSRAYHIDDAHVTTLFSHEILKRAVEKAINLAAKTKLPKWDCEISFSKRFDRLVQRKLKNCDIFIGWSGGVGESLQYAKTHGAVTVLERGSTHILYQHKILQEEFALQGFENQQAVHPKIIENELNEYQLADYIAIPSSFVKQTFLQYGVPEEKLFVNYYGANFKLLGALPEKPEEFVVIFCGSGGYRKGLHYLLQAFDELKLPKAKLLVIGHIEKHFRHEIKKYQHAQIQFIGSLNPSQLIEQFSKGQVFCLPSLEEGMALVLLQAMACGLPVICTPNTGAQDILQDGKEGFLIPMRSVEAIKEKLQKLYENRDLCNSMGESSRVSVQGNFTWDAYGERAVTFYKKIR